MKVNMRRKALEDLDNNDCTHAGLLLDSGFLEWDEKGENHNAAVVKHHEQAGKISKDLSIYKKAYEQWKQLQLENQQQSHVWFGQLKNRMFLGMGTTSPIEAGIMLHHTYGVPYIPGSAIKGALHHYAQEVKVDDKIQELLFGKQASPTERKDSGSAGCVIFNNAWWVPQGEAALTPEIITVHAQEYYKKKGKTNLHPDLESPNPNPQIAIQGSFMFSIEGDKQLARYAIKLLQAVLEDRGVGGKVSTGYGQFEKDIKLQKSYEDNLEETLAGSLSDEDLIKHKVDKLTLEELPILLGKSRTNTKEIIGEENWENYLNLVRNKFGDQIKIWNNKKTANPNQVKAYNTIFVN